MMHRNLEQNYIFAPHNTHATRCPSPRPIALSRRVLIVIGACFVVGIVGFGLALRDGTAGQTTAASNKHTPLEASVAAPSNLDPIAPSSNLTQQKDSIPPLLLLESGPVDAFGNDARNETEEEEPEHHRCAKLPRTQSMLHSWLEYEASAALSLLHSIAASLALLILPSNTTTRSSTPSACGLAFSSQEVMLRGQHGQSRRVVQEGLFFDAEAESFWTVQRPAHSQRHHKDDDQHEKAVWVAGISNGDCLVCTPDSDCAGLAKAQQQIRKTMAHAPGGWGSVHLHECQEQEQIYLPHPQQRWKNECAPICVAAYGPQALRLDEQLQPVDPSSMAWLACQICQQIDGQVDVAGEVDIKQAEVSADELEKDRIQADRMMSRLFHEAPVPPDDELWPTSRLAPPLGRRSSSLKRSERSTQEDTSSTQAVRAFFLDWTGDLSGVSQLLAAAISEPETLRHLFADTHNHTSEKDALSSKEQFAFADQLPFRKASPHSGADSDGELYDIDSAFVQTALNRILSAGEDEFPQQQRPTRGERIVKLGGGGGGGMGLQLECLAEGETADADEATPLLSVGGGGGGGYRSSHQPGGSIEIGFFNGGAGGGAGLQSWGLMDPELPTADGGLTVGGGGGGGIRLQLARKYKHSMRTVEGRVLSHKHGASPDELIALPPAEQGPSEFSRFSSLLARRMRACMATPGSKLVLHGAGGAGGGVKLSILDALRADPSNSQSLASPRTRSTTQLRHSVNFKLSYEFNTCEWDRSTAPCAEIRPFPDRHSAQRMRVEVLTQRKLDTVRSEAARSLALLEHPLRNDSTRGSGGAWSGEMQRQLADCLAKSRDLSRQLTDAQEPTPSNSTAEGAPSRVSRKVAFDDLLCTCFFSAFGSTNSTGAVSGDSWMLPSFCRRKQKRKKELARIRGEVPRRSASDGADDDSRSI